jgi:lysophospholipase L1-like esterase
MMEGINDLAYLPHGKVAPPALRQMTQAYRAIINRVQRAGAQMWLSPLTPAGDLRRPTPYTQSATPEQVELRHQINRWIRGQSGVYDAGVDFEPVVMDPQNPNWLRAEYDSGDNLHLNNAGYAAMGRSIGLRAFKALRCN